MLENRPASERPRERLLRSGASGMSLRELLAILLGSGPPGRGCLGLAEDLLRAYGYPSDSPEAERALFLELEAQGALRPFKGLGVAGRCRLLAAMELGRRYAVARQQAQRSTGRRRPLRQLEKQVLARLTDADRGAVQEWLGFIPVYRTGQVGSLCIVARGSRRAVTVDQQELFRQILGLHPSAIILVHNHPSGMMDPSPEDHELTRHVAKLCEAFQIYLLDHWIVAATGERSIYGRAMLR